MFSRALLLVHGHVAWEGPTGAAAGAAHLASLGFPVPRGRHAAEYLMLVASEADSAGALEAAWRATARAQREKLEVAAEGQRSSSDEGEGSSEASTMEEPKRAAGGDALVSVPQQQMQQRPGAQAFVVLPMAAAADESTNTTAADKTPGAGAGGRVPDDEPSADAATATTVSGGTGARHHAPPVHDASLLRAAEESAVLLWREWVGVRRAPGLAIAHLLVAAILAVWIGAIYWRIRPLTQVGAQNRFGVSFFTTASFGFSSLSALDLFIGRRALFRKEVHRYHGPAPYYFSKVRRLAGGEEGWALRLCDNFSVRLVVSLSERKEGSSR